VISLYNNELFETLSDKDVARIVLTDIGIDLVDYLK